MISCGHCGGRHPTVAEVRSCSGAPAGASPQPASDGYDPSMFDEPAAAAPARRRPAPVGDLATVALEPEWDHLAGPSALGRNLVITDGQAVPAPWELAPRVRVEADHPDTVAELRTHRLARQPIVIELAMELPAADPSLPCLLYTSDAADE